MAHYAGVFNSFYIEPLFYWDLNRMKKGVPMLTDNF